MPASSLIDGIPIRIHRRAWDSREGEPVRCAVPFPRGQVKEPGRIVLEAVGKKAAISLQSRVLANWTDGSVRWLLLDWLHENSGIEEYRVVVKAQPERIVSAPRLPLPEIISSLNIGERKFSFERAVGDVVMRVEFEDGRRPATVHLQVVDDKERPLLLQIQSATVIEAGAVRSTVAWEGTLRSADSQVLLVQGEWDFFHKSSVVRGRVTLRNPRRARHPDGQWDLGDEGSLLIRDASLIVRIEESASRVQGSAEIGKPAQTAVESLSIYQDSSGGRNWRSSNHINRNGAIPVQFCGYRATVDAVVMEGLRATPTVWLAVEERTVLGAAVPYFWQNFPKILEASRSGLRIGLFPRETGDLHELQGGEQKTHELFLTFGPDPISDLPLQWTTSPVVPVVDPGYCCETSAVDYLVPQAHADFSEYDRLVHNAIGGPDSFDSKREVIDEYGWRHFGDIYGDHEAVFSKSVVPLVSHYNNQYDAVFGFGCQFLRSGDARWWDAMHELARHVVDIDTYHTNDDKSAYSGGQFWHTYHYIDAGTATHRTYPKAARVCGGGPSAEHAYARGLMLHYYLTGDHSARREAIALADWVLQIEDGGKTIFRWLSRADTGLASSSGVASYHGPGRGPANAIAVLLVGFQLTGERRYLLKAEQLIRRVTHPMQDLSSLQLLDAERRWYYTMYLQSLGSYLDLKQEMGEMDAMYGYGQAVLLHYAAWMATHETPYLDRSETLEYPTETWAAQDIRKSDVFYFAAKHCSGREREKFVEKGRFYFDYAVSKLGELSTRTLCRPVVLLLSNGLLHDYFQSHSSIQAPPGNVDWSRYQITRFVPQKERALRRLKMAICFSGGLLFIGLSALVYRMVR